MHLASAVTYSPPIAAQEAFVPLNSLTTPARDNECRPYYYAPRLGMVTLNPMASIFCSQTHIIVVDAGIVRACGSRRVQGRCGRGTRDDARVALNIVGNVLQLQWKGRPQQHLPD